MNPFEFFIPQNITVGAGTLAKLPECAKKLGGSHAMLISGPTLRKMGVVDKAADYLKDAGLNYEGIIENIGSKHIPPEDLVKEFLKNKDNNN